MAKRRKKNRDSDDQIQTLGNGMSLRQTRNDTGPQDESEYEIKFILGEPIDMAAVNELRDQMNEVKAAEFEFEEEDELLREILMDVDPLVRGALYISAAESAGEPVVVEDDNSGDTYQLYINEDTIERRKIKTAEFGVRDQKDNVTYALSMAGDAPPIAMTPEERELWAQSPALALSQGMMSGDPRWIDFLGSMQEEAEKQKDYEDQTLEHFFNLQQAMYEVSKAQGYGKKGRTLRIPENEEQSNARLAWAFLRQARVFHIDPEIYRACDMYCTEVLAGLTFVPPQIEGNHYVYKMNVNSEEETEHHIKTLRAASPTAPMPEQFPFEVMFLGYGPGLPLMDHQAQGKFFDQGKTLPPSVRRITVLGALITATGYVFECFKADFHNGEVGYICEPLRKPETGFIETFDLAPWYLPKIVEFITSHKMYVLEQDLSLEQRRYARKIHKNTTKGGRRRVLWVPPPYYRMRMKDTIIRDKARSLYPQAGPPRTYRTDVVGHERLYVRRGPLPLSAAKRAILLKREYKVFENMIPPPEITGAMVRKGHVRKMPDEWVAVRVIWIDEHMNVNDESLPYVPAIRTTGKTGT
jgi:hypothetical protein